MNILFVSSSYFLRNIPVAILNKREIIKLKMQRYKDVKVYLYSFILPDYMTCLLYTSPSPRDCS